MARVLVVDDDRDFVSLLARWLEHQGFEVVEAYDGRQALEVIAAEPVDLVTLDVMLPEVSGWDVLAALRSDAKTEALPVLLVTAILAEDATRGVAERGADMYLRKPFDVDEFTAAVKRLLRPNEGGG